jgi:hypothetical protein
MSGNGGAGGSGGHGGGGAGGTVMFKSTLFSAAGGTINTSGGSSAANEGDSGRYVVSENSATSFNFGTPAGTRTHFFSGRAARDVNPFIEVFGTTTFNIAGVQNGADVYGILNNVSASDTFFDGVRSGAPANAVAALVRSNVGPTGDDYLGQDHLLLVNLTETPLSNPALGLGTPGSSFSLPLLERGFDNNPIFGGGGAVTLSELPANSVYATLIGQAVELDVNVSMNGFGVTGLPFATLNVVYLAPPVILLPGDYNNDGTVNAADYTVWRNNVGQPAGTLPNDSVGGAIDADQYLSWKANYGQANGSGSGADVAPIPEPTTMILALFAAIMAASTGIRRESASKTGI